MQAKDLYRAALNKWGEDAQLNKVVEECAELIQALCKRKIKPNDEKVISNLLEECADVRIMLGQLETLIREDWELSDKYDDMLIQKHAKLEKRLQK